MFIYCFLLLFFLKLSECCSYSPYTFRFIDRNVSDHSQTFQWLVVIKDIKDSVFKLGYGALIHPRIVLTSTLAIDTFSAKDLMVQTRCSIAQSWVPTNCTERQVVRIVVFKNKDKNHDYHRHSFTLLILSHPFSIDGVEIADNVNNINQENCYFLRWTREMCQDYTQKRLVTVKYKTSFNDGHLNVNVFNRKQLRFDKDFIISRAFHLKIMHQLKEDQNFLNFLGSPLICQHKKKSDYYVLAGIGTFSLKMNIPLNIITLFDLSGTDQEESLINIINYHQQILEFINFTRSKN